MAVLITGGAGYIGSHMVFELLDRGEEIAVIDNLSTGVWWVLPPEANLVEGDIGDDSLLDKVMTSRRFDAVIHFAGSIVVPDSVADPLGYYLNNTVKSRTLIAAAVRHGIPNFIFSSTAAVYGEPKTMPVTEEAAAQPVSPYGTSKLMTEWMLRDSAKAHGLRYAALRYFNVAGADERGRTGQSTPRATHLIKVACQTLLGQRRHMEIFGRDYDTPDGTCIRDYIHVDDLGSAHVKALEQLGPGVELKLNLGTGRGYSVREVIDACRRVTGLQIQEVIGPRRPGDPPQLVADSSRAQKQLDWQPQYRDIDAIVSTAWRWHSSHPNGYGD
jgi:UDP-glucose 4-epimerase